MSTHSDTTPAIDRKATTPFLAVVVTLALAFTTGCSLSLVDKKPEILRYCPVAERSELSRPADHASQPAPSPDNGTTIGCPGDADRVCGDDEIVEAVGRGETVNCGF